MHATSLLLVLYAAPMGTIVCVAQIQISSVKSDVSVQLQHQTLQFFQVHIDIL
jgi:hypothetical protein